MSSRPELRLAWCNHAAARYAVEHWHYSRTMPAGKNATIGVWEDGRFIGAVLFGTGAGNATRGERFGLARRFEVAELVRVALRDHKTPVSRIVSIALRMVHEQSPGIKLIVSFADPYRGHVGGVYQAGGWLYIGTTGVSKMYIDRRGREHHERVVSPSGLKKQYGRYVPALRPSDAAQIVQAPGKHIYLWPFDSETRALVQPLAKPYPKRAGSSDSAVPPIQGGEGGASPTPALHSLFPMTERLAASKRRTRVGSRSQGTGS